MFNVFAPRSEVVAYFASFAAAIAYAKRVSLERDVDLIASSCRTGVSRNEWCKWN